MLKFYVKVFYVMGKALSDELSCPCDRSCYMYSNYLLKNKLCLKLKVEQHGCHVKLKYSIRVKSLRRLNLNGIILDNYTKIGFLQY